MMTSIMEQTKEIIKKLIAVLLALGVWQLVAMFVNTPILIVTPIAVVKRLCTIWQETGFLSSIWFSFYHIVGGYFIAIVVGVIAAILAKKWSFVETLLWPWVAVIKSVPVASFVVICLIWLSTRRLSVFIAFLIAFPVIYQNLLAGLKSLDKKMDEVAVVYKMSFVSRLRYIILPQLKPFIFSACSISAGMAWKAGVAAEVIGIPNGSIGKQLYLAKTGLDTSGLLAWTVIIVVLAVGFEKIFLWLLSKVLGVAKTNSSDKLTGRMEKVTSGEKKQTACERKQIDCEHELTKGVKEHTDYREDV